MAETELSLIGRTLGEFIVRDKLGAGGAGLVFRAEQPLLAREAVIKVLRAPLRLNENTIQRFMREARLASSLDHPYAAHIYAFGVESDGLLWIAMELVRGTTLDNLLKTQGPLPLTRFVSLFDRICEVVQSAHDQGIIHRDIKPANVMVLSRAGRLLPKLLDFGIAKLREDATEGEPITPRPPVVAQRAVDDFHSVETISGQLSRAESLTLTQRGFFVGSPHYMAPEQWVNAAAVDERTDIYALGVLCFEALTGHRPFDGKTASEIAREHAKKPVPPLAGDLPETLQPVLSRALAKRGRDRFASALELAAAFRAASGLAEEPSPLPQLESAVRESMVAEGPQPIAEAVTALEASRTVSAAIESAAAVSRVAARYLGLLALASRGRIGAGGESDSTAVMNALRSLRRQSLDNQGWLSLARELCRPFVRRREAYPIPELVSFFFEQDSESETKWTTLFEASSMPEKGTTELREEEKRELLGREVARLNQLLRALSFCLSYPLVVTRGDRYELWTGVRRSHRSTRPIRGRTLPEGRPMLVDRDGTPVLSLWPLMQTRVPSPGVPEEMFMLEGNGRHGAKLVAIPLGFERHDDTLWGWFRENVVDVSDETAAGPSQEAAPYLGLAAFTPDDAKNFFGREQEAEAFANRLRVHALLAVVGPSGSGKSSFVQAGVIPLLPDNWRSITFRPGASPLAAMAACLAHHQRPMANWRELLSQNADALGDHLRLWAQETGTTLVVVVDQFEELLTLCPGQEERLLFSRALAGAARSPADNVRVILTLRDDFLIRAQQLPALKEALGLGLQLLGTPAPEDLIRILTEPARRAGYEFDDPELPGEMVRAVADQPGALALLSFTAGKLWELRDRHFLRLTRRAYHSLGGVGGALAQHAEATLAAMKGAEQTLVREAFRHLVTAERTRAVLTRNEMSQVLGGGGAAESALERLIQARLLTASEGESGEDRIEVIHEALITSWPRLVRWQQEDAESARMRHQLRAAARQWEERGRGKGLLWRGEALMEYRVWRSRYSGRLTDSEEAFAAASLHEEARGRQIRRLLLGAAFLALAIGLVTVTRANRTAQERLRMIYEEQGRQLLLAGDPLRGIVYLDKAYQQGASGVAIHYLLGRATRALDAQVALLPHLDAVVDAHFSPDGSRVVTASRDKTAKLWNVADGKLIATLSGHSDKVHTARFSSDGARIVTSSSDGTSKVWDGMNGALLATLEVGPPIPDPTTAGFSPDDQLVITAIGKIGKVWDAKTFALLAPLEGHTNRIKFFQIDPRNNDIFTYGQDGFLKHWTKSGQLLFSIAAHQPDAYPQYLRPVALAPDGKTLATGSNDYTARVWDAATGSRLLSVQATEGFVFSTAISPDGKSFATACDEPIVTIWNLKSGGVIRFLRGHTAAVWFVSYNRDGTQLLTGSSDTTARLWNASGGGPTHTFVGHTNTVVMADWSPDERRIVTASLDGTARIWDRRQTPLLAHILDTTISNTSYFLYGRMSQDDKRILTATEDGKVKLWQVEGLRLLRQLDLPNQHYKVVDWSPNERLLAVAHGSTVTIFDFVNMKRVLVVEEKATVLALQFTPEGSRLATGLSDGWVGIRDVHDGRVLLTLNGHADEVGALAFTRDGKRLISGGGDKRLNLWDAATGVRLLSIDNFKAKVYAAAFSPDGTKFITASRDKRLVIWDAKTGKELVPFQEAKSANVQAVDFSEDGSLVVTADVAGAAVVWDAKTGRALSRFSHSAAALFRIQFSHDANRILAMTGQGDVSVWDTRSDARSSGEISAYVRCRVPFRIQAENLVQSEIDPAACGR